LAVLAKVEGAAKGIGRLNETESGSAPNATPFGGPDLGARS
jgi:hypothetical protein